MPSGKTHDAITFLLVPPTAVVTWQLTQSPATAAIVTGAMLVGGLMFGPDLDTHSKQYTRWGFLCFLWYPYQVFFRHRSRWSHGLIFGTLLRVIYFMGVLTLLSFLTTYGITAYQGGETPSLLETAGNWQQIGEWVRANCGEYAFPAAFAGLWVGAASHTVTDIAGSFIKHGRVGEFL